MEKLGLTYPVLKEANPKIIMISFPGYGIDGPYSHYKGYGANVEAVVGHTWLRGYPDSDPTETYAVYHADPAAGASAAFALLAALYHREQTGEGQFINMAQSENVINHFSQAVMDFSMNGRVQNSLGNRDPSRAPQGAYPCQGEDAWIAISVEDDEEFAALCKVMGKPELASDERFADVASRHQNHDELDEIISAWTKDREHFELFHQLQREGVTAGPILTAAEVLEDPHLNDRGYFETITHPVAGTHPHPGPVFDFSATPLHIRGPAPCLGEHNEYVYKDIIGVSDEEYTQLVEEKHIGDSYLPGVI
jgi:crotonobetainyl-CoA:carnitine CoA-transferase CaiB-like acyl-CoA transferase